MGWGMGGKGGGLFHGKGGGLFHNHGMWHGGWWHGPSPLLLGAEVALVGGVAAAVVASTVARPMVEPAPIVIVSSPPAVASETKPTDVVAYTVARPRRGRPPPSTAAREERGKGKGDTLVQTVTSPRVKSIRLPPNAMEFRGDVNFFAVDVTADVSTTPSLWRVMRRYIDFKTLADSLGPQAYSFPDAPFPNERVSGRVGAVLENRRQQLEVWLQRAFDHQSITDAWVGHLRDFVDAGQEAYASTVSNSAVNATPSMIDTQPCRNEDCEIFELEVPPGVCAGDFFYVGLPGGKQLALQLPENLKVGDTFRVVYDVATGALLSFDRA